MNDTRSATDPLTVDTPMIVINPHSDLPPETANISTEISDPPVSTDITDHERPLPFGVYRAPKSEV
jgi:hypothetical protein